METAFIQHTGFSPTFDQKKFLVATAAFLKSEKPRCSLILNGYAGTGKTTLVSVLVQHLKSKKKDYALCAPTGRAAKVMSAYSKVPAYTIHKLIYQRKESKGNAYFTLKENKLKNTLFIVDEASMIGGGQQSLMQAQRSLLDDLIEFVFSAKGCKLLLVGDQAQLPPVGSFLSPALNKDELQIDFDLVIARCSLKEVVRQAEHSLILQNATHIRKIITEGAAAKANIQADDEEVIVIQNMDMQDLYESELSKNGWQEVTLLCRSNKKANIYNQQIRNKVHGFENILDAGDKVMIVKNNYFWLKDQKNTPFLANGDMAEVNSVKNQESRYGFEFADVELYFPEFDLTITVKANLDALLVEGASIPEERIQELYQLIDADLIEEEPSRSHRKELIKNNRYWQALQLKYANAITCHKAQGGQWKSVFIDHGYLPEGQYDVEFYRWLYTAITRATDKVFFLNPNGDLLA